MGTKEFDNFACDTNYSEYGYLHAIINNTDANFYWENQKGISGWSGPSPGIYERVDLNEIGESVCVLNVQRISHKKAERWKARK